MGLCTQGVHMYFKGGNSVSTVDFSYFLGGQRWGQASGHGTIQTFMCLFSLPLSIIYEACSICVSRLFHSKVKVILDSLGKSPDDGMTPPIQTVPIGRFYTESDQLDPIGVEVTTRYEV